LVASLPPFASFFGGMISLSNNVGGH
jgi:hypothetical protein